MILTVLSSCVVREVIRPLRAQPIGHIKIELLNHGDSVLFHSLSQSQNPDVWHLANIVQDLLDWEQNECRERGSSFHESTTGNKPIKKQETQHKPDLCHCLSRALCLILPNPQPTHIPTPISLLFFSKSSIS